MQDDDFIFRAEKVEALEILDFCVVRLLALVPEYDENLLLIDECVRRGSTGSAAQATVDYLQMERAAAYGVTQVTHWFNAMQPLGYRELGAVGAALALPQINCVLIADNIHVHPVVQK